MKNTQRGSMALVLSIIIVLLVVAFGIYIYSQSNNQTLQQVYDSQTTTQNSQPAVNQNQPVATQKSTVSPVADKTIGWKTYSGAFGYTFNYPSTWTATELGTGNPWRVTQIQITLPMLPGQNGDGRAFIFVGVVGKDASTCKDIGMNPSTPATSNPYCVGKSGMPPVYTASNDSAVRGYVDTIAKTLKTK